MTRDRHQSVHAALAATRLIAVLLMVAFGPTTQAGPSDELKSIRGRIEALQKQLSESESSQAQAADALKDSERAVSQTSRKIYEISGQRRSVNAALSRLQARARVLESNIEEAQAMLERLLYQQYVGGQSDAIKLVLNGKDPNEIARQLHYLSYISRARAQLLTDLRENLADLDKLTGDTRRKSAELHELQREESLAMQRLEKEKAQRQQIYAKVSEDIEKGRKQLSTLKLNEERLSQLVERLAKEAAARKKPRKPGKRLANKALPEADTGSGTFRQLKGKLHLPVIGELMNRFGGQRQDSGLSWKGIFIAARPGKDVKAIASGRVVYADWLRGFGNLLILDHGDGYMSLYGNNESLLKQTGEEAKIGDTIASTGNSGGNPDSGLYFELRFQGKPFDPIPWVTLK